MYFPDAGGEALIQAALVEAASRFKFRSEFLSRPRVDFATWHATWFRVDFAQPNFHVC